MPGPFTSLDLGSLSLLVLLIVISCCVATLLSWIWVTSISSPTFIYCATCSKELGFLPGHKTTMMGPSSSIQKITAKSSSLASLSNTLVGSETDQSAEDERQEQVQYTIKTEVIRSESKKGKLRQMELWSQEEETVITFLSEDESGVSCSGQLRSRRHHSGVVGDGPESSAEEDWQKRIDIGEKFFKPAFINSEEILNASKLDQTCVKLSSSQTTISVGSPRPGYENLAGIQFALFTTRRSSKVLSQLSSCDSTLSRADDKTK